MRVLGHKMELWRQLSLVEHYFQEVLDMRP